ncbi:hypothetical protein AtubIFM55763_006146 [Aspergillus tubingensis]|uniref:Uncharacterized protein n=3 Tax=Aspergillus subgen. Circumdati TaxID=2720871 RepID=A0A8H3SR39_ASPTU|nr:hypothetical protein BO79DRAFT_209852 [Aspergillus costaricaensis CBS 115574]XP_035355080.1 pectate lyase family protein [Aspergillus tubingensis]GAQ36028.1 similar to An01g12850 [Aspergillus niger]RAK87471.1 hypothetical protein BO79DRAFT_209852 [Aspergillus costaricaensis CBS 115574]GFN14276.1 pectate lyase family protein [Aspergillus tubingensis]GLA63968.1 hypothetical protein AtubIFM54640_005132 [Aspergillus tubingensis]GLA74897.1 hypothetical protein AtubIFM55763_006146 [Aspergillus t
MYSYTPTSKFLVLAPTETAPLSTSTQVRERSSSQSSTASGTTQRPGFSRLPSGFLYLGVDTRDAASPSN